MDLKWKSYLESQEKLDYYKDLMTFLEDEYSSSTVYPPREDIFRALELTPYSSVNCVIIGQDPYFNPGEAQGIAFSVPNSIKIPPSLRNIYKELEADIGVKRNENDLTSWAKEGVLLLNRVLTVRGGAANSHSGRGWEEFTLGLIKLLSQRERPMVFILWGKNAQGLERYIDRRHLILKSPHPSPLSAYRGFWGSNPFSKTNNFLKNQDIEIDWR